ncbi:hypothetical protein E2C01_064745 [Portunus trituberculatus]|uniref:Uncharacterized protein n=1 Tax=Portunus trituberculatus TaxID=210409 RepID=A0A5B7HLN5_PORTR|nr:hypothetical protein [Portunus trituberculatus]
MWYGRGHQPSLLEKTSHHRSRLPGHTIPSHARSGSRNLNPLRAREKECRVLYNWTTGFWKLLTKSIMTVKVREDSGRWSSVPEESPSFFPQTDS